MAIEITERFSDRSMRRGTESWEATRGFDVTGLATQTEDAALAALENDSGGLGESVAHNTKHPQAGSRPVKVSRRRAEEEAPGHWHVFVVYTEPSTGDTHPTPTTDPLDEPILVQWIDENLRVPIDSDFDGNPIVNGAREGFRNLPTDFVTDFRLIILRNEPFFDIDLIQSLRLSVNSTDLVIGGQVLAKPLEARLMRAQPEGQYQLDTTFVTVRYEWLIKKRIHAPEGVSPHGIRVKSIGFRGLASVPGGSALSASEQRVHVYEANDAGDPERPVTSEVDIDSGGAPIKSGYLLGEDDLSAANLKQPLGSVVETSTDSNGNTLAVYLWYSPESQARKDHVGQLGL